MRFHDYLIKEQQGELWIWAVQDLSHHL